jgi:outer membrane protein TolC
MRWKHVVVGLALTFAGVAGCKQQCFLMECDYNHYQHDLGLPQALECDPSSSQAIATGTIPTPITVDDCDRNKPRYMTLQEAVALALENGTTGNESPDNPGTARDDLIGFTGQGVSTTDSIRVFALDPALAGEEIEKSLARFDAQWNTQISWNSQDRPLGEQQAFNNGSSAQFLTELVKPLPTGGTARIQFGDPLGSPFYQFLTSPQNLRVFNQLNPIYQPQLTLGFEQPLLQGYGIEMNQLSPSAVIPVNSSGLQSGFLGGVGSTRTNEGILITRLRFDQSRAEFERNLNFMLFNVKVAYWNLYDAYWTLYAQEAALRQAYEAWRINKARYEAGRIAIQDFAQTRQQYELFRGQRLSALGQVLENERQLRTLIGLPREDGTRLVPIDEPTLTPYQPDWNMAANEALTLRPELVLAHDDLKAAQLNLIFQKNALLPDLRFLSNYTLNGAGTRLDGSDNNALRSLASDRFIDWNVGLRLNVPIGFRDAHSRVRAARLNLTRSYRVLQDQEQKALGYLELQYRHLFEFHDQIEIQRSQRIAAAQQLDARFKEFLAGRGTLDILLEAQRVWATALSAEFDAIRNYNNALVGFEFAKGTIMREENVNICEGPLPCCAKERAAAHEKARSLALVARERENPEVKSTCCDFSKGEFGIPELPANTAPNLAPIVDGKQPLPVITEPWDPKLARPMMPKPQPQPSVTTGVLIMDSPTPTPTTISNGAGTLVPSGDAGSQPRMLPNLPASGPSRLP